MATLVLTTVGTLLGGPVGGALGALAGRSIDGAIFGGGKREGPRVRDLAVTTSSYGQPIARHHGRMRAAGTIIWATDLVEHKDKAGGKKGQPSVTTFSYTMSFAVALSSRPIAEVGRIWADGNLLRGAGGDLKVPGRLRIHRGGGDQLPDPLIAAAHGGGCPAFRDCAYVVFEDLALGDFGNRIPALSFEVIADDRPIALADMVEPAGVEAPTQATLSPLAGFADEGGPLLATLATIDTLFPLACDAGGDRLTIDPVDTIPPEAPPMLPAAAQGWDEGDFGAIDGARDDRRANEAERPAAIRYYDPARDFQPGVQRPSGRSAAGRNVTIDFPGALAADDARLLADTAARRSGSRREALSWRVTELDPALGPGRDVRVPGRPGIWRIESWEWRSRGIELSLVRRNPLGPVAIGGDAGQVPAPIDVLPGPTALAVFETPAPTIGTGAPTLFAAATSTSGSWAGAALYLDRAGELLPLGRTGSARATIGWLTAPLRPSQAILFEEEASVELRLAGPGGGFTSAMLAAIAQGANRLLVGGEVLQFATAIPIDALAWRLGGLLRGRGGTESAAMAGHGIGTAIALLDEAAVALDPSVVLATLQPKSPLSAR